jgi:hypothetical protein
MQHVHIFISVFELRFHISYYHYEIFKASHIEMSDVALYVVRKDVILVVMHC